MAWGRVRRVLGDVHSSVKAGSETAGRSFAGTKTGQKLYEVGSNIVEGVRTDPTNPFNYQRKLDEMERQRKLNEKKEAIFSGDLRPNTRQFWNR